ncbi:MAG: BatD family protein [Bacteroidetes bacterium]|nr:BatD family protein [Bacteroidota bacterium]MDA1119474.1 BatD family protein [Bacteroidota bacterium]
MNIYKLVGSLLMGLLVIQYPVSAQEISIHLGPDEIGTNQAFTITITVENERLRSYDEFPEIPGFVKRGTSSSSSTNFINGQVSSSQSIIQNYVPTKEGTYNLPPFIMTINDQRIKSEGKQIKVSEPVQSRRQQDPFTDPFEDFFGRQQQEEYVDVDADAFLALTTDKNDVYQGEGFTVTLAFYVSEANRAQMQFYDLGKQLTEIVKKLKPANCWEENFNIENISQEPVTLNGEKYNRYKIFQAAYFPLNNETIEFPPVELELIKYKVAKRRTFFGQSKVEDYETFTSRPKSIKIKDLPPHPLKSKVPVGIYELEEQISGQQLGTGQSFNYSFNVKGDGNISAIDNPYLKEDGGIDLYPPNIRQNITRGSGRVRGLKTFSYFGVPNEPGEYNLGDYFWLPYFDPQREVYDTLRSDLTVYITGESKKNEMIQANDLGSFYDLMQLENNDLRSFADSKYISIVGNIFIFLMLILTAVFIFKK